MAQVEAEKPDLVCLDITMPEKSGVRFFREMKSSSEMKGVPIIIVTGVIEEFRRFIHTRRQVPPPEGYLSKPIDEVQLLEKVKELIG